MSRQVSETRMITVNKRLGKWMTIKFIEVIKSESFGEWYTLAKVQHDDIKICILENYCAKL